MSGTQIFHILST